MNNGLYDVQAINRISGAKRQFRFVI